MQTPIISNQRRLAEITAVVLTAAGKFVFMDWLNWRFAFVAVVITGWSLYVISRHRSVKGILPYWGFRTDTFRPVFKLILPYGIAAVLLFIAIGWYQHTIQFTWHILPILVLYPIWGIIQQFLLIAITAGNLQDLQGQRLPKWIIILFSALLFALVHYPYDWLMAGTFLLALFYGWVYLKKRNIYVLGVFHGWLGGLFFYTVVNRDPFAEMFGKLLGLSAR